MDTRHILLIGKGIIAGTFCESFWRLNTSGMTGYNFDREPTTEETDRMLEDIQRHRSSLFNELSDLRKAERILKRKAR
jgi:hypothetical protein